MTDTKTNVYVVDDDHALCDSIKSLLKPTNHQVISYSSCETFLEQQPLAEMGCIILDIHMPNMSGLALQQSLIERNNRLPIIFITASNQIDMAIKAMKQGAFDFLTKPIDGRQLVDTVLKALDFNLRKRQEYAAMDEIINRIKRLTPRERQVMALVTEGKSNRIMGEELGISSKTVELHRAKVMTKMKAKSLAQLVKLVTAAQQIPCHQTQTSVV